MEMEIFTGTGEDGERKGKCYYVFSSKASVGDAVRAAAREAKVAKSLMKAVRRWIVRGVEPEQDLLYLVKQKGAEEALAVVRK